MLTDTHAKARPSVADLFAGAGGFSLGFSMAGFRIRFAVEVDAWACETLRQNHPDLLVEEADVRLVSDDRFRGLAQGGLDVLIGGPPCQGFSVANNAAGDPSDPRNSLFKEFVRAVDVLRPTTFLMENVPGLLRRRTEKRRPVIDLVLQEFRAIGYECAYATIRAQDYGLPQIRERLFVVGKLADTSPRLTRVIQPQPDQDDRLPWVDAWVRDGLFARPGTTTLWQAIGDLPQIEAREGAEVAGYDREAMSTYARFLREDATVLHNHVAMKHSAKIVERFRRLQPGQSCADSPEEFAPAARNSNGLAAGTRYDQNNRRMYPDRPCHTIPASFYANFVHPYRDRNFTAREGARVQGFPDSYRFLGKPTVVSRKLLAREGRVEELRLCQYNQIGNAVPPLLARVLAERLLRELNSQSAFVPRWGEGQRDASSRREPSAEAELERRIFREEVGRLQAADEEVFRFS